MRKRTLIALGLASVFALNAGTATVDASWLSKTLDKINTALGVPNPNTEVTQQSDGKLQLPQAGERWILISENKYYKTYIDRSKVYAKGEAQDRFVTGVFKREFTPLGSQWLGGFGEVKPDVVTVEYYNHTYEVNRVSPYGGQYDIPTSYYDVHGNLIYRNGSIEGKYYGNYVPDSEEEHIKDRLFHLFGWDY